MLTTRLIGSLSTASKVTCWEDHNTYQQAFAQLLRDLKAEAEESATPKG
jgi:hypothetical protein